jgi:cytochrome c553
MKRAGASRVAADPASSTGRYAGRAWAPCFAIGLLATALLPAARADDVPDISADLVQCAGCHGADGKATSMPTAGRIAGQNLEYLRYILRQYRAGRLQGLNGGVMTSAVRHLDDARLDALARHYSRLE